MHILTTPIYNTRRHCICVVDNDQIMSVQLSQSNIKPYRNNKNSQAFPFCCHTLHHRGAHTPHTTAYSTDSRVAARMHQIRTPRTLVQARATATTAPPILPYTPHNKPRIEAQPNQPPIIILPGFGNCTEDYEAPFGNQASSVVSALEVTSLTSYYSTESTTRSSLAALTCSYRSSSAPTGSTWRAASSPPDSGPRPAPPTRCVSSLLHLIRQHNVMWRRQPFCTHTLSCCCHRPLNTLQHHHHHHYFYIYAVPVPCVPFQGYRWYLDRVQETINLARRSTGSEAVDLVGHSAGGWLARAYLADPKCVVLDGLIGRVMETRGLFVLFPYHTALSQRASLNPTGTLRRRAKRGVAIARSARCARWARHTAHRQPTGCGT